MTLHSTCASCGVVVQVASFLDSTHSTPLAAVLAQRCLTRDWHTAHSAEHALLMQLSMQQRIAVCKAACTHKPLSFVLQRLPSVLHTAIVHACTSPSAAGEGLALHLDNAADITVPSSLLHASVAQTFMMQLPHVSGLAAVSLRNQHLGSQLTAAAVGALASAPLTRLVLAGNDAGEAAMWALVQQLPQWGRMSHLDVADNGPLASLPATALVSALVGHTALTYLWLGADISCAESVQEQLAHLTALRSLHPGCDHGVHDCEILFAAVQQMQLTQLDLSAIDSCEEQDAETLLGCAQLVTLQWDNKVFECDVFHLLETSAMGNLQELSMRVHDFEFGRAESTDRSQTGWQGLASLQHFTCLRLRGDDAPWQTDDELGNDEEDSSFGQLCSGIAGLTQLRRLHFADVHGISADASTELAAACQGLQALQALTLPVNVSVGQLPSFTQLTELTKLGIMSAGAALDEGGAVDSFAWLYDALSPLSKLLSFQLSACTPPRRPSIAVPASVVRAARAAPECKRLHIQGMAISVRAAEACASARPWNKLHFEACRVKPAAVQAFKAVRADELRFEECDMSFPIARGELDAATALFQLLSMIDVKHLSLQGTRLSGECFERVLRQASAKAIVDRMLTLVMPTSGSADDGEASNRVKLVQEFNETCASDRFCELC